MKYTLRGHGDNAPWLSTGEAARPLAARRRPQETE